jgi:hypothetical protein
MTTTITISDLAKLEIISGTHRPVLRGAMIGALAGVVLGAIVGAGSWEQPEILTPNRRSAAAFGAIVFGVPGLVLGGLQGLIPRDQWRTIPLDGSSARFNLHRLPGGGGVSLALAF